MLKSQRENPETSRAGLKWDDDEENQLLSLVSSGESLADIAKTLQRTEGSIKTRLIVYAISKMENDNLSISQVCEMVNLAPEDITDYQQKKQQREDRIRQRKATVPRVSPVQHSKRPTNVTNADIYDLLLNVNRSLQKLSSARS
jgi:hypothetical protein